MKRITCFAAALLLLVFTLPVMAQDAVTYPTPTGAYGVGRAYYTAVDDSRPEIYTADPGDHRELGFFVWYPAEPNANRVVRPLLEGTLAQAFAQGFNIAPEVLGKIRSYAQAGVPVAAGQASYPVLIMSHGTGGLPIFYTSIAEQLASHGYIVVGISHTFNAAITVLEGRIVRRVNAADPAISDAPADASPYDSAMSGWNKGHDVVQVFADDVESVLTRLESLNAADPLLGGKLDLAHLGVFGHSLGGAAAAEVLYRDARFLAGANLDGSIWSIYQDGVPAPYLTMSTPAEQKALVIPSDDVLAQVGVTREQAEKLLELYSAQRNTFLASPTAYYLILDGVMHGNFTDVGLLRQLFPTLVEPAGGLGTIEPTRAIEIVNAYLVAFFDTYVKGEPSALLHADPPPYPEVTLEFHGASS